MGLDVTGRYRYPPPDPAWLARREEPVVEPGLPVVDAHHHLWTEGGSPYLLDEFADDLGSGHDVLATVFVQAHHGYRADGPVELRPVGETERVAAMSAEGARRGLGTAVAAAIVAHADLTLGWEVGRVLDAHEEAADGRFRGVRHSVSRDPHFPDGIVLRPAPAGLLASSGYRDGLASLARRGLTYDAMLYHSQLPELTDMARALPDLPIVLDHFGCVLGVGPYWDAREDTFRRWRNDMRALAACGNVSVKMGGLGMIVCGARWHERPLPPSSDELAAAWRPFIATCLDLFGPERCMFESNFPVDKAMYSYRTLWNAFKLATVDLGADERAALLTRNAARFYGLRLPEAVRPEPVGG